MEFSGVFGSLVYIGRNLTLVEFSGIPRLVEFGRFLGYGVDSCGNFRLVDYSGFFRFQFWV